MRVALGARVTVGCLFVVLSACGKPAAGTPDAPAASASVKPHSSVTAPVASASAAPAPTNTHWIGTYTSAPGSLFVQDGGEWKGVHFRGDDASVALGEGPLSLTVDAKTNLIRGDGSGPLGDVVISGAVTGDYMTFSVFRKDARDRGLTGTGLGKITGAAVEGTMRLSRGDAHVIREARFSLSSRPPP